MKQMMKVAIVAVGCVALMTIGCGGGSDDEGTDANTPTPDTTNPTPDTTDPTPDTTDPTPDTTLPPPIDTGPPPPVESTCGSLFECLAACPPGDQGCQAACIGGASQDAQNDFNTLVTCQQGCPGAEPNTVDIKCMVDACFDEAHACMGKPGQELDCNGIFTCLNSCPQTDPNCPGECLLSAQDKASFDTFFAIIDCIQENCPVDPNNPNDPAVQQCGQTALAPGGACEAQSTNCMGAALPGGKPGVCLWSGFLRWYFDMQIWLQPQF